MTFEKFGSEETTSRNYGRLQRLSRDEKKGRQLHELGGYLYMAGFMIAVFALVGGAKSFGSAEISYAVAALGLPVIGYGVRLRRDAKDLAITTKQASAVKAYDASKAVSDLIDTEMRPSQRKVAENALNALILELGSWYTSKTPQFMSEPANDLAKKLKEKVLPIITEGDQTQIELALSPLQDLVNALDTTPNANRISVTIDLLDALPTVQSPANDTTKINKRKEYVMPFLFLAGAAVMGVTAFYGFQLSKEAAFGAAVTVGMSYFGYRFTRRIT